MSHKELLALGVFGPKSRIGDRIEMLLRRGRTFSPRASMGRVAASAVVLLGFLITASFAPRWIAFAQQEPRLSFEVASIKPSAETARGPTLYNPTPERFMARNITAKALIAYAYDVREFQISGVPRWFETDQYDIVAKPQGDATRERIMAMVQNLLLERFGLKLHRESKELPVFALVIAKGGPKLHAAAAHGLDARGGRGHFSARDITMHELAAQLAGRVLGRPIIDRTGLNGGFDVELEWASDHDPNSGPSIFTAIQEQLGLRLESAKGPVEILVIDHAEKPTEN